MVISKILPIILVLLTHCVHLETKKNPYFNPTASCLMGVGRDDMTDKEFSQYTKLWELGRQNYNEENLSLKKPVKNVIVGNSLIHLFQPDLLKREFEGFDITARGIGGDMTDLILQRLSDNVFSLKPTTVIYEIGGNDLIARKCLSYIQNNVNQIILSTRKALPSSKIIFVTVPPTSSPGLNAVIPTYNLFLYSLPRKYKNLVVVDLWEEMRSKEKIVIKKKYTIPGDKIHFNEKGYTILGKLLRPLLAK